METDKNYCASDSAIVRVKLFVL